LILFGFHLENDSIINSFHTVAPNSLQPSWCTQTHQKLFEDSKLAWHEALWFGRSQSDKAKQTTLLHRWTNVACVIGPSVNPFQNKGNSTYEIFCKV